MDRKYQLKWTRACHCLGRCTSCYGVIKYRYQVMVQEAHASMYASLFKRACHFVCSTFFFFAFIILTIYPLLYCQTVCGASKYRWSWAITSGVPAIVRDGLIIMLVMEWSDQASSQVVMPAPEMRYVSSCYFAYSHVIIICSISHTH